MATLSLLRFAPRPAPRLSRPSLAFNLTLRRPNPSIKIRPRLPPISASSIVPSADRVLSVISYTVPFFISLPLCRILISRYPLLASLASHLALTSTPTVPISNLMMFFTILFGLSRNPNMSVYVRFNAMQAAMLHSMPVLLWLVDMGVETPSGGNGIGVKVVKFISGAISLIGFASFVYCMVCSVVGRTPYLPFVSPVAKWLV